MHGFERSAIAIGIVLACFLSTFGAPSAHAGPVYYIGTPNAGLSPFSGPYATVNVELIDSTTAAITFTSLTATSGNAKCTPESPCTYLMGSNSSVALNVNATDFSYQDLTFSPSSAGPFTGGDGTADGFGNFNLTIDNFDGFTHAATMVSFNLINNGGTWTDAANVLTPNAGGYLAAAHIFVQSDLCDGACVTGYAANGDPAVPEPGTLALLGAGLIFIGGAIRRFKW
jgi:hypothetical protein